jgi:chromosome segregation ATPase
MIAPAWALTAWPYIKRALPYLAVALAIFAAYNWAYSRGKASQVPIIRELTAALKTANDNTATLQTALEEQNAAVALLATREAEARKAAAQAVEAGQKRARELSGTKARLDALARSRGNVAAVPVPDEVRDAWSKLK